MRRGTVAALIVGAVLVVTAVTVGIVSLVLSATAPGGDERAAVCESRFGTECSDIPLDQLEAAFNVDLPDGTTVISSEYTEFQDWRLTATFELPDGDFALPEGWEDDEPGVFRSAQLDGTRLTLTAFTT